MASLIAITLGITCTFPSQSRLDEEGREKCGMSFKKYLWCERKAVIVTEIQKATSVYVQHAQLEMGVIAGS